VRGQTLTFSDRLSELTGFPTDDLIDRHVATLFAGEAPALVPEASLEAILLRRNDSRLPVKVWARPITLEEKAATPDGHERLANQTGSSKMTPADMGGGVEEYPLSEDVGRVGDEFCKRAGFYNGTRTSCGSKGGKIHVRHSCFDLNQCDLPIAIANSLSTGILGNEFGIEGG
jgi:hypothetical protein